MIEFGAAVGAGAVILSRSVVAEDAVGHFHATTYIVVVGAAVTGGAACQDRTIQTGQARIAARAADTRQSTDSGRQIGIVRVVRVQHRGAAESAVTAVAAHTACSGSFAVAAVAAVAAVTAAIGVGRKDDGG